MQSDWFAISGAGVKCRFVVVTLEEMLQMLTFLGCVVLSPSLYMLLKIFTRILFNLGGK